MDQWPISKRQREALEAIKRLTAAAGGIPPTFDELALEMGISDNAAMQLVKRLVARGHLRRLRYAHRSMQVIQPKGASAGASIGI